MNSEPLLSIIIPVYNAEKYLARCLDSILRQSYSNLDIICINDGSSDSSLDILNAYANKDRRIVIINQNNSGAAHARNAALKIARGEFITFADADDEVAEDAYLNIMSNYTDDIDIICFGTEEHDGDNRQSNIISTGYFNIVNSGKHEITDDFIIKISKTVWNKIFRKDIIIQNDITFPILKSHEDNAFVVKYLLNSKNTFNIKEKYYIYYRIENSIMHNVRQKKHCYAINMILVVKDIFYYMLNNDLLKQHQKVFEYFANGFFRTAIKSCHDDESDKILSMLTSILKDFNGELTNKTLKYLKDGDYDAALGKNLPKFSIIVPCYKAEASLPRCLDSLLNSTLKEIEVICLNDASPDNGITILNAYAQKDSRVKVVDFKENQGAAAVRNAGLDMAQGEIIGFVDSDDDVDPTLLADIYRKMQETGSDINIMSFKQINPDKVVYNQELAKFIARFGSGVQRMNSVEKLTMLVDYCWHCSIRRSFWEKHRIYFPTHIKNSEDQCFWKPLQLKAKKVSLLDTYGYNYYFNPAGLSKAANALYETMRGHDEMMARLPLEYHLRLMEKCFWWMHVAKMKDRRFQNRLRREYAKRLYDKARESGRVNYEFNNYNYRFFGGLCKVTKRPDKKVYTFLGIPYCKVRYAPGVQKTYVLGVKVKTRKLKAK